jgi:hypothetical protein
MNDRRDSGLHPLACMPSLSHPKRRHQAHVMRLEAGCSSFTAPSLHGDVDGPDREHSPLPGSSSLIHPTWHHAYALLVCSLS